MRERIQKQSENSPLNEIVDIITNNWIIPKKNQKTKEKRNIKKNSILNLLHVPNLSFQRKIILFFKSQNSQELHTFTFSRI